MKILVISDIHGNLRAMTSLKERFNRIADIEGLVLLGDLIDYGPHSNEVIELIRALPYPVLCNIWGNHEQAVANEEYGHFSSERGRQCARHTRETLSESSWHYIRQEMEGSGKKVFWIGEKRCLAVHGSLEDEYWSGICPSEAAELYQEYDYVFSGHTHIPHFFEGYYRSEDRLRRNKKKTVFINPGSAGQPRNLNPMAQCALLDLDLEEVVMMKCRYDIASEQRAFSEEVDSFYRDRLEYGI